MSEPMDSVRERVSTFQETVTRLVEAVVARLLLEADDGLADVANVACGEVRSLGANEFDADVAEKRIVARERRAIERLRSAGGLGIRDTLAQIATLCERALTSHGWRNKAEDERVRRLSSEAFAHEMQLQRDEALEWASELQRQYNEIPERVPAPADSLELRYLKMAAVAVKRSHSWEKKIHLLMGIIRRREDSAEILEALDIYAESPDRDSDMASPRLVLLTEGQVRVLLNLELCAGADFQEALDAGLVALWYPYSSSRDGVRRLTDTAAELLAEARKLAEKMDRDPGLGVLASLHSIGLTTGVGSDCRILPAGRLVLEAASALGDC